MRANEAPERTTNHHDRRRSQQDRTTRRCCGTGRPRCAGESLLDGGRHQSEGRAQGPENGEREAQSRPEGTQGQENRTSCQGDERPAPPKQGRQGTGTGEPLQGGQPSPSSAVGRIKSLLSMAA